MNIDCEGVEYRIETSTAMTSKSHALFRDDVWLSVVHPVC